jgi:hypothetical protein
MRAWFAAASSGGSAHRGTAIAAVWKQKFVVLLMLYPVVFALFIGNIASVVLLNWLVPWAGQMLGWWLNPIGRYPMRVNAAGAALVISRAKYGIDMNYIGQTGVSMAQIALVALQRAGRDLTVDSLVTAMESLHEFTDIYGNTYSFGPNRHHGSTKAFLAVVKDGRWVPVADKPLSY